MTCDPRLSTLLNPVRSATGDGGHEERYSGSSEDQTQAIRHPRLPREFEHEKTGREEEENGAREGPCDTGLSQAQERPTRAPQHRRRHRYIPVML